MTQNKNKRKDKENDQHLIIATRVSSALCFALLILYLVIGKEGVTVDYNVLILFFGGIGIFLLPFLSRLKILGVLELERMRKEVKKEIREVILRSKVVRDEYGKRFYIDNEMERHSIPDDETASFLSDHKGEIQKSTEDLDPYPLADKMDSVLNCSLLNWKGHLFVVLNGKKYHIGSASFLADWQRHQDEFKHCDDREIRRYLTGR